MKPRLLVIELWGLGDLVIATPFLQAAAQHYEVTLLAKPYALELQTPLWPGVRVVPFVAPWTAFTGKYRLVRWPWRQMWRLRRQLAHERFTVGLSARWIPGIISGFGWCRRSGGLGFPGWAVNTFSPSR